MKKRNTKIRNTFPSIPPFLILLDEYLASQNAKPICAKFGPKTHNIIASGDDKNQVSIWKLNKERPLMVIISLVYN